MVNEKLVLTKYEWGNKILTVRENKVIHKKLQSDPDFASRYFRKFVGPKNTDDEETKISSDEEDHVVWSYDAVKLLVNEYKSRIHRFNNPEIKNTALWNEIAEVFKNENKPFPVHTISRKFFNMKTTYYKIIKNKRKVKTTRRPWPWIKTMEEILKADNSINFTNHITISDSNSNNNDIIIIKEKSEFVSEPNKSSSNEITDPIDYINKSQNTEENIVIENEDVNVLKNEDNWEMIDDTSNFSSSFGISSDHDCNSSKSQSFFKNISDYRQKMIDLKTEEVKILKLIHKDMDEIHYSRMESNNELTIAIKEHTVILKELADAFKERFLNK